MAELAVTTEGIRPLVKREKTTHPVAAYMAGLSEGSRRGQFVALRAALAAASGRQTADVHAEEVWASQWEQLRHEHVAAIRSRLQETVKPTYANKVLAAVRGVLKSCWRLDLMSRDNYARAADVPPVRGETLPAGRDITGGEIAALMRVCCDDPNPAGVRDAAMIGIGLTCGPRIAEVMSLELQDYDQETGRLVIRGKGNKERTAYPRNGASLALNDWLHIRGDEPGALFCPYNRKGELEIRAMSDTAIRKMIKRRARTAGVSHFTWHDFRRTAAGNLLDAGADLVRVQGILGHADPRTTARYDRRPESAKAEAMDLVSVPYFRRPGETPEAA
jgi:site-specific recombinase XerD